MHEFIDNTPRMTSDTSVLCINPFSLLFCTWPLCGVVQVKRTSSLRQTRFVVSGWSLKVCDASRSPACQVTLCDVTDVVEKRKKKEGKIYLIQKQVVELAAWIRLSCQQLQPSEENTQWLITQCLAGFKLAPMGWPWCCFSVRQTKGVPLSRVLVFFNRHRYSAPP